MMPRNLDLNFMLKMKLIRRWHGDKTRICRIFGVAWRTKAHVVTDCIKFYSDGKFGIMFDFIGEFGAQIFENFYVKWINHFTRTDHRPKRPAKK